MKYSFVLPAYKAHYLKEAIGSILNQTYTDFELVVVDDASPQNLSAIVGQFNDPRLKFYTNNENIGGKDLVKQWNHCLEYAKGEYVILASDDDIYHREYLQKMDVLVDKYPKVNVFRPRIQQINGNGDIIHIAGIMDEFTRRMEFASLLGHVGKGIPFYIFNRRALLDAGGFINYPSAWHSDNATVVKLASNGAVFCNEILFSFRQSNENISTKRNNFTSLKMKLEATLQYYDEFPSILDEHKPDTPEERVFLEEVKAAAQKDRIRDIKSCILTSSTGAIFRIFPRMLRIKGFSFIALVETYVKYFIG